MRTDKLPIYPVEPWNITETEFKIENNYRNETTFALSNGYIGTRGTFEEGYDFDIDTGLEGNFINGFYEREEIRYGEASFGFPLLSQSLLNLPNLKGTKVFFDDEEFDMRQGTLEDYSRTLLMKEGLLERKLIWTSPSGKRAAFCIRRLVSFAYKNIMAMEYQVTPLNFSGEIRFVSKLQGDVENHTRKTNPIVDYGPFGRKLEPLEINAEEELLLYKGITQNSKLTVGGGSVHKLYTAYAVSDGLQRRTEEICHAGMTCASQQECKDILDFAEVSTGLQRRTEVQNLSATLILSLPAKQNCPVRLEKMICYTSDLDMPENDLMEFVKKTLGAAKEEGFAKLAEMQRQYMKEFWDLADIEIQGDGNEALKQGLRFNLFHIFQSAGRDGRTGMGAKGLSGEGYEGHYFWDTEMYILPVFIYTNPQVAKSLLEYRYDTLDKARDRAKVLGHLKGALYPWRTINGEEASTYYPLGTAQYHINADIEYALALYLQVTGDVAFFKEKGAEIILDTARIWADVGSFAECRGGKYCICSVTGPDEYNVLVDNNFYTNLMAREHLRDAVKTAEYLCEHAPETWQRLVTKLELEWTEVEFWKKIVDNMYFPYDEERQIYPMDDGFMMRKPWDENRIPPEKRAWLYENYHPLFIMRHRMSKQADAVLGMYLHSNLFTKEELKRNYDFYQEVTLHHSSLSTCIFGIVASSIDYDEEAYQYFSQSARMDLDDYHNNFYAGIHAANMAGTWQAVINGFAGLRCFDGTLHFHPHLPKEWESYRFHLRYREAVLRVEIRRKEAEFTLVKGRDLAFYVNDKRIRIAQEGGTHIETI